MVRFVKFSFNPLTRNEVRFQSGIKSKPANPFPKLLNVEKKGLLHVQCFGHMKLVLTWFGITARDYF